MKRFKKRGFWVFYLTIVLAGAFIIIALGLQNQSPVILNVSAQQPGSGVYGSYPSDVLFSYSGISQSVRFGVSPQNVLFAPTNLSFVGDIIFPVPTVPVEKVKSGSGGKTGMRTILTCYGFDITRLTCEWSCGVTFSQCGTGAGQGSMPGLFGGSYTFGICPTSTTCGSSLFGICSGGSYTFGTCPGTGAATLMTCAGGNLCIAVGNTTFTTCSLSIGCGIIGGYTLNTCIGCRLEPGWEPIDVGATRWQSCGTFQMHVSPGLPSGYSATPAL